jgi:hypothetical protein
VIGAGATFGFQPIAPDLYLVGLDANLTVLTKPAFAVELTGDGSLAGIPISESKVHGDADGYFSYYSKGEIDLGIITASNEISGYFNAKQGLFSASVGYDGCVGEDPFVICSGFQGLVSSAGIGGCALGRVGFSMRWGEGPKLIGPFSCDMSDYQFMSAPLADAGASAGERAVTIPSGLRGATLRITGEGGPPSVVLISPSGERFTPVPPAEGSDAPVTQVNGENEALIGLASPEVGSWTIEPQPGPAISTIEFARNLAPPTAKAKIKRGKGRKRTLTYRTTSRPGLETVFFERVGKGISLIGSTTKAKGKISFRAADGPAGKRTVFARIDEGGLPRLQKKVASYRAPGPIRPRRPKGLKVHRKKSTLVIGWRKSAGAGDYLVRIKVSDGRNLQFLTNRTKLKVGQMRRGDRVKVSVVGRSKAGRAGKAARITKKVR